MPRTLHLDSHLVQEAITAGSHNTACEAISAALKEYVARRREHGNPEVELQKAPARTSKKSKSKKTVGALERPPKARRIDVYLRGSDGVNIWFKIGKKDAKCPSCNCAIAWNRLRRHLGRCGGLEPEVRNQATRNKTVSGRCGCGEKVQGNRI
jgi:hypothetical protein